MKAAHIVFFAIIVGLLQFAFASELPPKNITLAELKAENQKLISLTYKWREAYEALEKEKEELAKEVDRLEELCRRAGIQFQPTKPKAADRRKPLGPIPEKQSPVFLRIGKGQLRIDFDSSVVYLLAPKDANTDYKPHIAFRFLSICYKEGEEIHHPTEGFLQIGGKAKKLALISDGKEVLTIDTGHENLERWGAYYVFKKPGNANVCISVAGHSIKIPIRVVQLPITEGMPAADLIERLGMPDSKDFAEEAATTLWRYKQFPSAAIKIHKRKVVGVETAPERSFEEKREQMKEKFEWFGFGDL